MDKNLTSITFELPNGNKVSIDNISYIGDGKFKDDLTGETFKHARLLMIYESGLNAGKDIVRNQIKQSLGLQ